MGAGVYSPQQAGEGPSIFGIAKAIGSKIRDAAEEAKEEREKADKEGVQLKKGSLFKSALSNKFNPVKSKKSKANWNKQFSWNQKKSDAPSTVNGKPTGGGSGGQGSGGEKLKNFIAGGFSAILKDTTQMVSKLNSLNALTNENVSSAQRSSDTLTVIKETLTTQTDLRRKAIESAKYAQTERQLEKTRDPAGLFGIKKPDAGGGDGGDKPDGGGNGWLDWILNALGIADLVPDKWWSKFNPFKSKPKVTTGGTPPGPRMPGGGPKVTTSGGAPAPKIKTPTSPSPKLGGPKPTRGGGLWGTVLFTLASIFEPQIQDAVGGVRNELGIGLGNLSDEDLKKKYEDEKKSVESITNGPLGTLFGNLLVPSFTEFSELPMLQREMEKRKLPLSKGGIVDNPTETDLYPGDRVIPLNTKTGRELAGVSEDAKSNKEMMAVPFKTVGAAILGISNRMLKASNSGIAGDMVRQDIAKLSRDFGIANVLTTTSLGRAQFGQSNTEEKSKNFLAKLLEKVGFDFGGGDDDGSDTPTPTGGNVTGGQAPGTGQFTMTSGFGPRTSPGGVGSTNHQGIDYNAPQGTPIAILKPGKVAKVEPVVDAKTMSSVRIIHDDGTETRYAHLSRIDVAEGQQLGPNSAIGLSGGDPTKPGAGPSTGPHVHFEYYTGPNAGPSDGSGVAAQYFTLGGQIVGSPSPRPMQQAKGGNVAVLALGTNDWGVDSSVPQYNTQRIIKYVREKGYNPVVVPPFNIGKFKKPRSGVVKGANNMKAPIIPMEGKPRDRYGHNGESDRSRIGSKYQGALTIGDSNAVGIGKYTKGRVVGGVGQNTDTIWNRVKAAGIKPYKKQTVPPSRPNPTPSASRPAAPPSPPPQRAAPRTPQAAATRPAPQQPTVIQQSNEMPSSTNTVVVQAPRKQRRTAIPGETFGSMVPGMSTVAATFSDFLYEDLV